MAKGVGVGGGFSGMEEESMLQQRLGAFLPHSRERIERAAHQLASEVKLANKGNGPSVTILRRRILDAVLPFPVTSEVST